MAVESGGGRCDGGAKRRRVDELDDRCEAVGLDAIPVDRISALPDELRFRVLTHLPLKDAIRTGALACGWRDLWKGRWPHRASLEVRLRSRDDLRRELDALAREPRPRRRLDSFSLILNDWNSKASELQRFLGYATECGVEDLHVETRRRWSMAAGKLNFHLPLSSPALARLSLRRITVSMFYNGAGRPFHALEVIQLVSVSFRPGAFRKMIWLCPNLHILDLHSCSCNADGWVFDKLPPNLRSLTIAHCDRFTSLDFVCVPTLRSFRYYGRFSDLPLSIPRDAALSDLYIQLYSYDSVPMNEWNIDKLRRSLPMDLSNLNVLTICYRALTGASVLPTDGANAQMPIFNLHSLKELHLLMLEMKSINLANLYLFLRTFQCPNLERLFVQLPTYKTIEHSIDQVWEELPEDGLDNLVMVKVMNFNGCPTEVQLVSFLLRKARSLRKLLIVTSNVTPMDFPSAPGADLSLLKESLVNGKIMLTTSDNVATQPYHEAYIKLL